MGAKPQEVILRKMEAADVDDVVEIEELSFARPWTRESIAGEVVNKAAFYTVAESGGRVIAYAGAWLVIDEAHITNVAVHPDFRGKGIGEAVTRELIRLCAGVDIKLMYLEVRVSNKAAISLYKKLGFKILSVRKKYYEDNGEDAFVMFAIFDGTNPVLV